MKRFTYSVIVSIFLGAFVYAGVIGDTNEEVKAVANPILDSILDGMKTNDYTKYSKDFDDTMKNALPKEAFLAANKQIRDYMGEYKSREYLGFLKKNNMTVILWKSVFDKSEDEFLVKLIISKQKDKYLVTGLWFQ